MGGREREREKGSVGGERMRVRVIGNVCLYQCMYVPASVCIYNKHMIK